MSDEETITIKITVSKRWTPSILSMLKYMEYLGNVGSSRMVTLMADGDGDFHPKFELPDFEEVQPKQDIEGNRIYDAG